MLNFEIIEPPSPFSRLPARIEQRSHRTAAIVALAALGLAAVTLVAPFVVVAAHLAAIPSARTLAAEQPASLFALAMALVLWGVLLGWPMHRLARSIVARRSVSIDGRAITVHERGFSGARAWSEPISGYSGLAHHIRASLSGIRHELILVHPDHRRCVLVATAPRFSEAEVRQMCALLGTQEVPSQALYRWPGAESAAFFDLQSQNA